MGNWIPGDATFVSQLLKLCSSYMPPPSDGFVSPMTWGVDAHIIERFGQGGVPPEKISTVKDTFHFVSADSAPAHMSELFRRFYGPTMNAFEAAEKSGRAEELSSQLVDLVRAQNESTNGGTLIPATYLRVTIQL